MKNIVCLLMATILAMSIFAFAEEPSSSDEPFLTGIVVDATMNSIVLQWTDGKDYIFTKTDETDMSGLADGLTLGSQVTITYSGFIDFDKQDTTGATLLSVSDAYPVENAQITKMLYMEGDAETIHAERYVNLEARWSAWYDVDNFVCASSRDLPASIVRFVPSSADAVENTFLAVYTGEADFAALFAESGLQDVTKDEETGATVADNGTLRMEGYVYTDGETTISAVLSCPVEAQEGYGVRLQDILDSIQLLDADGKSEVTLYVPDENAQTLSPVQAMAQDDPQGLMDALFENQSLTSKVHVNSFSISDDVGTLDLDATFAEMLSATGTAGESMYLGSVVNTMIDHYQLSSLMITCEGDVLETGHAVYDAPLSFFESNQ